MLLGFCCVEEVVAAPVKVQSHDFMALVLVDLSVNFMQVPTQILESLATKSGFSTVTTQEFTVTFTESFAVHLLALVTVIVYTVVADGEAVGLLIVVLLSPMDGVHA